MAVSDDTVKTDFVKVGCLKLQHFVDAVTVDLVTCISDFLRSAVLATETGSNDLLGVLLEKLESFKVSTCGDLDQLCESVSDLGFRQSLEEGEVEEGLHGSVVGTQTVLVLAVVDGDLDGDGGIDETDDGGRDTDEVGVAAVGGTSETKENRLV